MPSNIKIIELAEVLDELDVFLEKFYEYLISCGVQPKNKKLKTLITCLDELIAMKEDKTYYGVDVDSNNIIKNIFVVQGIVENNIKLPNDILRGYYHYEKGKIVLDEKLRQKLWGE